MAKSKKQQKGASAIVYLIILAVLGVGVYVGMQYIPQYIESATLDSVLAKIEKAHGETRFDSRQELESAIRKQLDVNEMDDMMAAFKVAPEGQGYKVDVRYERTLNLIYEKRPMVYEKTLLLN